MTILETSQIKSDSWFSCLFYVFWFLAKVLIIRISFLAPKVQPFYRKHKGLRSSTELGDWAEKTISSNILLLKAFWAAVIDLKWQNFYCADNEGNFEGKNGIFATQIRIFDNRCQTDSFFLSLIENFVMKLSRIKDEMLTKKSVLGELWHIDRLERRSYGI